MNALGYAHTAVFPMAIKRRATETISDEPAAPADGGGVAVVVAAPPPMPLIGAACDKDTPGFLMGIGKAPETKAQHDSRLGAVAGKFNDIGYVLGTLEARDNWPAAPVVAAQTGTGTNP